MTCFTYALDTLATSFGARALGLRTAVRVARALRLPFLAMLPLVVACGDSPTAPSSTAPSSATPPASPRSINVVGNLSFGEVPVGSQRTLSYTVINTGTSPLTITGTTISGGLASHTFFSWTSGQIAAGGSQTVNVRFQPTAAGAYAGTISVNGDHTSGTNVVAISGSAAGSSVNGTWTGQYIVERCDGTGSNQDYFCSNGRGAYPPGTSLPVTFTLTQNGTSVNGTIALGRVIGTVNGSVNPNGSLVLQGAATNGTISVSLSSWSTTVSGAALSGSFTFNAGLQGVPGVAIITSRFNGVTRQ